MELVLKFFSEVFQGQMIVSRFLGQTCRPSNCTFFGLLDPYLHVTGSCLINWKYSRLLTLIIFAFHVRIFKKPARGRFQLTLKSGQF